MITLPCRLAALDIGSLTIRLGIGEVREFSRPPNLLHRQEAVTRLGEEISATGRLGDRAQANTLRVLARYARLCRHWQVRQVSAVATQAVRQAADQDEFCRRVLEHTGLPVEILSPETEARLALQGILASLDPVIAARRPLVVFDLGGGSLELAIFLGDSPPALASFPCGALTLARSWQTSDPPRAAELAVFDKLIRRLLPLKSHLDFLSRHPGCQLVGSGGAITTLAALHLDLEYYQPQVVNNVKLSRDAIARLMSRLQTLPQTSRARLPGLSPAKADVIIPGAAVILAILEMFSASCVTAMDASLLEGVLARLADLVLGAHS